MPQHSRIRFGGPAQPYAPCSIQQAIALLRSGAAAGNAEAQYLLGSMYLNGVGVAADPQQARALLTAAAEHGEARPRTSWPRELSNSEPPAGEAAHHWLERSAALGYARAADALRSGHLPLERADARRH